MATALPAMTCATRYLSAADTARLVREQLKAMFPGIKFSVRISTSGSSIRVRWTDGPTRAAVESAVHRYRGSDFDPMQDIKTYRPATLITWADGSVEQVRFLIDFIFCDRDLSPQYEAMLEPHAAAMVARNTGLPWHRDTVYDTLWHEQFGYTSFRVSGQKVIEFLSCHLPPPAAVPTAGRKRRAPAKDTTTAL